MICRCASVEELPIILKQRAYTLDRPFPHVLHQLLALFQQGLLQHLMLRLQVDYIGVINLLDITARPIDVVDVPPSWSFWLVLGGGGSGFTSSFRLAELPLPENYELGVGREFVETYRAS